MKTIASSFAFACVWLLSMPSQAAPIKIDMNASNMSKAVNSFIEEFDHRYSNQDIPVTVASILYRRGLQITSHAKCRTYDLFVEEISG